MSWNVDWQVIIDRTKGHAPRERVSWNFNSCAVTILQWCHAPRERVSWNRVVHGWAGQRLVTLHVSVWVEIEEEMLRVSMGESRSTWACELKWFVRGGMKPKDESRSTWACELKYSCYLRNSYRFCHAPRERVSWNIFYFKWCINLAVTLHVSVWVEIEIQARTCPYVLVTLHVSVWVEILIMNGSAFSRCVTLHVSVWVEI